MRCRAPRWFVAGLALAAVSAQARSLDWGDDPVAARTPAYAASRAICRRLAAVVPPPGDAPTAAEAAALGDCSSEALYYGIGRAADPSAARLCAVVETRAADPQVTDFGFTGDRMLMVIYANGLGAARNLGVATALACRAGGTPAEIDARVRRLDGFAAGGWAGTGFSLCDDASSRMMGKVCADHDQLIARSDRARAFAAVSAGWSAADRAAFAPLKRAAAGFVDAHAQNEVDSAGPERGTAAVEAEDRAERAFADLLADAEAGRIAPLPVAEARAAETALDVARRGLALRSPVLVRETALTAAGLRAAERAWTRYRDAWLAFAEVRYPALPPAALLARLMRERAAQLAAVPAVGG